MNPYQTIIDCLNQFLPLSAEAVEAFVSVMTVKSFKKKEHLVEANSTNTNLNFILKGAVREYLLNEKEEEIVVWFGFENDFAVALPSFISQQNSKTAIQALEETEVIQLSRADLYQLYDKFHEIERLGRMITEQYLMNTENYHYEFHYLSAPERYNNLLKNRPEIFQRVSLQMIASYLGISNETLSRIRAKRF